METASKTNSILVITAIALTLGLVFDILFFQQMFGINVLVMTVAILIGIYVATKQHAKPLDRTALLLVVPILFFATMIFVRASALLTAFNLLGLILLLLVIARSFHDKKLSDYLPLDYFKTFFTPVLFVLPAFEAIGDAFAAIFSLHKASGSNPRRKEIVRGTVMSIVAVIVFAALFAGADATFNAFITKLFSFNLGLNEETIGRLVVYVFASVFFLGSLAYAFRKEKSIEVEKEAKPRTGGVLETTILLGSINGLFLFFIVLQVAHLFGGGSEVASQGITFAEYARKGFFELIIVAVLSYLIISTAEKQIIKNEHSHAQSFKLLSTILVVQVIVILISAFSRLSLYESTYGFTTIRLYSHALMVWLAAVLILLAHHIVVGGERKKLALRTFIAVIVLLFAMNVINPDVFIAKKNLERYHATGNIDAWYLGSLSADAVPYTIGLLDDTNPATVQSYAQGIAREHSESSKKYSWPSFHISRNKAEPLLAAKKSFIEQMVPYNDGDFFTEISD